MLANVSAAFDEDDLQRWRQCPRRFWLQRQAPADAMASRPTVGPEADDDLPEGDITHAALRASFPHALTIREPRSPMDWVEAMHRTLDALDSTRAVPEGWALFGACLTSQDRAQARIDVLAFGEHGLRLFKLRHATVGTEADVDTAALWLHVAARCGLQVQSVGLLLIDTDFTYPGHGCYAGVFREYDLGPVLGSRPAAAWLNEMRHTLRGARPPASVGPHCTSGAGCEHRAACEAEGRMSDETPGPGASQQTPPDARAALDVLGRELAAELHAEGHVDLHTVPLARVEQARLQRALRAVQSAQPVLDEEIASVVNTWGWPRYFLRIDTIGFAIPVWSGTQPYQALPFQWDLDLQEQQGELHHRGFLASGGGDPRRAFAESLMAAIGDSGPVFAYNAGFERRRLRDLARLLPAMGPALDAVAARIVDLFQVARSHYYHPEMCGSWSFRSACRAMAPDVPVEWGEQPLAPSAPMSFGRSLQAGTPEPERQALRTALRAHGERQTRALRRMVAVLERGERSRSSV